MLVIIKTILYMKEQ